MYYWDYNNKVDFGASRREACHLPLYNVTRFNIPDAVPNQSSLVLMVTLGFEKQVSNLTVAN